VENHLQTASLHPKIIAFWYSWCPDLMLWVPCYTLEALIDVLVNAFCLTRATAAMALESRYAYKGIACPDYDRVNL
jgi:hypothetical protein